MHEKILVVDDELDMLDLIAYNLRMAHFEVFTAVNGQEALKRARTDGPDLIVLDLMLPDLDGFSICEILRRLPSTTTTPVLMLTAVAGEIARCHGLASGATCYMTKPFHPHQLVEGIRNILSARPRPAHEPDPRFYVKAHTLTEQEVGSEGLSSPRFDHGETP